VSMVNRLPTRCESPRARVAGRRRTRAGFFLAIIAARRPLAVAAIALQPAAPRSYRVESIDRRRGRAPTLTSVYLLAANLRARESRAGAAPALDFSF
jgi:hypothetical protein